MRIDPSIFDSAGVGITATQRKVQAKQAVDISLRLTETHISLAKASKSAVDVSVLFSLAICCDEKHQQRPTSHNREKIEPYSIDTQTQKTVKFKPGWLRERGHRRFEPSSRSVKSQPL
jgi:hypothetical protein